MTVNHFRPGAAKRGRWLEIALFVALWAAFTAYGIWLRGQIPFERNGELHGLDYNGHGVLFSHARQMVAFIRFRHPLFNILLAPVSFFGDALAHGSEWRFGDETATDASIPLWCFLCALFSAIVSACVWFVWRIGAAVCGPRARWRAAVCAAVFACFQYVRYLAACPESFSISMLLYLALAAWAMRDRVKEGWALLPEEAAEREKFDLWIWIAFFFLAAGITVTQGAKVLLAYFLTHRIPRRQLRLIALSLCGLLAAGCAFYLVKHAIVAGGKRSVADALGESIGVVYLIKDISWPRRLCMLEMFFFEPVISHGAPFSAFTITETYRAAWPYLACGALYAVAAVGAWRLRKTRLMRVLAAGFAIDILLHIVLFWGMEESQIYCGHWFYILPIFWAGAVAPRKSPENPGVPS